MADVEFSSLPSAPITSVGLDDIPKDEPVVERAPFPKAIIPGVSTEQMDKFKQWVFDWLWSLKQSHQTKLDEWAYQETQYRARSLGPQAQPFVGACGDVVPVAAMAIDPIHARLDTGIFKSEPVIRVKALRKALLPYMDSLEIWVQFYQKHRLELRQIALPRLLELTKHGTMIFKTIYDHEQYDVMTYDEKWNPVKKKVTRFKGPRVLGVGLGDFLFPPTYQHLQDCPIVFERMKLYPTDLKVLEASGKLANTDKVVDFAITRRNQLEIARQDSANHPDAGYNVSDQVELWEGWCDYDINGDGLPERLAFTFHEDTREILQLRYNWYFHQRKPYTVIPYSVSNGSLYGVGIGEMSMFFQDAQTKWHRMATDNAYLANIRMFVAKKGSGIEEVPKLYTGRTFFVDDPSRDFIPFKAAEIYPSSLTERQNLFGLAEKRTGVSDYLTGRESPIVGSRATATSTVALIQEGTRRVEEVLENIRVGFAEITQNCIYIWIQYGLDGLDDLVFGSDKVADDIKSFFDSVSQDNIAGAIAIDLSATDAANNRSIQQQVQLAIIQTMMQYLNKLVEAGQLAIQAAQTQPELTALINEVMKSARKMFLDLLTKYDIRNPEDYLPELEQFLNAATTQGQGGPPVALGGAPTAQGNPSIPSVSTENFGVPEPIVPPMLGNGLPFGIQTPGGM